MDSDADNTHTRGKNWSYNDIINLLYAAINLNVTEKLNNPSLSRNKLFKKLAEEIPDKNGNQVQIKYNRLRRAHLNRSSDLSMFREQMDALWGKATKKYSTTTATESSMISKYNDDDCDAYNNEENCNSDTNDDDQNTSENYETKFVDLPDPPKKRKLSPRKEESQVIDPLKAKLEANSFTKYTPNDNVKSKSVDMFFQSISETVKNFPLHLIVQAKKSVCNIIGELELQAFEFSQTPNTSDPEKAKSSGSFDNSD